MHGTSWISQSCWRAWEQGRGGFDLDVVIWTRQHLSRCGQPCSGNYSQYFQRVGDPGHCRRLLQEFVDIFDDVKHCFRLC